MTPSSSVLGFTGENGSSGVTGNTIIGNHGGIGSVGVVGCLGDVVTNAPSGIIGVVGNAGSTFTGNTGFTGITGPFGNKFATEITNLQSTTINLTTQSGTTSFGGDVFVDGIPSHTKPTILVNIDIEYAPIYSTFANLICCSHNGKFVSICGSGSIHVSNNYGRTFTKHTFNTNIIGIAASLSGKYQCSISSNIPRAVVNYSQNYGLTWTEVPNSSTSNGSSFTSVYFDYLYDMIYYCTGGGGGSMIPISNSGSQGQSRNVIVGDQNAEFRSDGYIYEYGNIVGNVLTGATVVVNQIINLKYYISGNIVTYVETNRVLFHDFGIEVFTENVTPVTFDKAEITDIGVVIGYTSTIAYITRNFGVSWDVLYENLGNPIKCIKSSDEYILILLLNGNIIRIGNDARSLIRREYNVMSGYRPATGDELTTYDGSNGDTTGYVSRTFIIPHGVWSVSFGFTMKYSWDSPSYDRRKMTFGLYAADYNNKHTFAESHTTLVFGDHNLITVYDNVILSILHDTSVTISCEMNGKKGFWEFYVGEVTFSDILFILDDISIV